MIRLLLFSVIMLLRMGDSHGLNGSEITIRSLSGCPLEPVKNGELTPVKLVYATNDNITLKCLDSYTACYLVGMFVKEFQQIPSRTCQLNGTWSGPSWMCLHGSHKKIETSGEKILNFQLSPKQVDSYAVAEVSRGGKCLTIYPEIPRSPIELQWDVSFTRPFALDKAKFRLMYPNTKGYTQVKIRALDTEKQLNNDYDSCKFPANFSSNTWYFCPTELEPVMDKLSVSITLHAYGDFMAEYCVVFFARDAEDSPCPDPPLVLNAVLQINQNRTEASYKCLDGYTLESSSGTGHMSCIQGSWGLRDPPRCSLQSTHSSGVGVSWVYFVIGFVFLVTGYLLGVVTLGCYVRRKNEKKKRSVPKPHPLHNYNLHATGKCRGGTSRDCSTRFEQDHISAIAQPTHHTFGQSSMKKPQRENEEGSESIYAECY